MIIRGAARSPLITALLSVAFAIPALGADPSPPVDRLQWSKTNFAGQEAGEIGGTVRTVASPLFYAEKIDAIRLDEKLTASGSICLPAQPASKSAVFVGWFNSNVRGWRFPTCVGFWI